MLIALMHFEVSRLHRPSIEKNTIWVDYEANLQVHLAMLKSVFGTNVRKFIRTFKSVSLDFLNILGKDSSP